MLETLRRLTQAVNDADSLDEALVLIVAQVRAAMSTDVCTVYLHDKRSQKLVFRATEGLNLDKVGQFGLAFDEGLVGWVATREEPLNLEDASAHPQFQLVEGLGEESFSAFLGAPIVHQRDLLGVLVVQQGERRRFSEEEEAFLITVSAQLAGLIAHAELAGAIGQGASREAQPENVSGSAARLSGVAACSGIGIGIAAWVSPYADLQTVPSRQSKDRRGELAAFRQALAAVRADIQQVAENLKGELGPEDNALFGVYLSILDDSTLGGEVASLIKAGEWAQGALSQVMLRHIRHFERMEHSYLRERAVDVRDLGTRVLAYLQDASRQQVDYPPRTILIAEELTASTLGEIPREQLAGIVSMRGSANSHTAILARAMGIPAVVGVEDLPLRQMPGQALVVDGYNGRIYVNPHADLLTRFEALLAEDQAISAELAPLASLPAATSDGVAIPLWVNTGVAADVQRAQEFGAEGVGLYRTEVSFLLRDRFPSEEEQRQLYREQLAAFHPLPVTMRTLDIGGDKSLPYFPIEESNPFLGWRGIRVTLDHPEIFLTQVRAMLRANEDLNNLRILLPMVTAMDEWRAARQLIARCHEEVLAEGCTSPLPAIGVMIEVPAAVYLTDSLAEEADFLSVGSNDLTQYLLAVDRGNSRVAGLYQSLHPAVLAALAHIVKAAHARQKPVSLCGELAGDPVAVPLLVAMGFDQLSMNAGSLLIVKRVLSAFTREELTALMTSLMSLRSAQEVTLALGAALSAHGLDSFIRRGGPA
ncbi:MAG: phosphoenolpyruvate--protein phosphotransferase [Luminiphilus sp.]